MNLQEFRALGLLQEVNRRVLHPAGLAMSVEVVEGDDCQVFKAEILDARADPEGYAFNFSRNGGLDPVASAEKAASVAALQLDRRVQRERLLGGSIQPIPGYVEAEPVSLSSDDATVALCIELAHGAVEQVLPGAGEIPNTTAELVEAILLRCIGPLVASLRLAPGGRLRATERHLAASPAISESPPTVLGRSGLARARYLSRELPRLCSLHEVSGGVGSSRTADCELYPAEAEEALALSAKVAAWPLIVSPPDGAAVLDRMEDLFSLAQAGMRYWRGDRADLNAAADTIHARLAAWRARRSELDGFLSGDLGASGLTAPDAVRAELESRAAPLREELAAIDAERASIFGALAPVEAALGRLAGP